MQELGWVAEAVACVVVWLRQAETVCVWRSPTFFCGAVAVLPLGVCWPLCRVLQEE